MTRGKWGAIAITGVIMIVILSVITALVMTDDEEKVSASHRPPTLEEEVAKDLTVRPGDILPEKARCKSDEFIPNSLPSTEKRWSDAVSTPFVSSDPDGMLLELFAEHCGNPTELDMSIQALSQLTIGEFNIGQNNPWMGKFLAQAESSGLRKGFLTLKDGEGKDIFVTPEYQEYAAMTNTILLVFKNMGVQERASAQNWHLPGPVAGELPRAVLNTVQENLPALVLEYTAKAVDCPLVAVGYNTGDKRFEVFVTPTCAPPVSPSTPGSPPPPSGGGCDTNCTPPPPGKCANQTGEFCGTPDSGPEYLDPRLPPSNPNVDVSPDPPPSNPPPSGAPAQQPGGGGVVFNPPSQPATPPTSSPPVGDPGGF